MVRIESWKAILLVAIASLIAGHARAADAITFNLGWLPQGSQAGIYLAASRGYYAAENLDFKIVRGYGFLRTANEIDQGLFEFGMGDATAVLLNRSNGGKTRLIGTITNKNPAGLCWIEGRRQIHDPSDLKGLSVGGGAAAPLQVVLPVWLKRNGINPADVKLLQLEPGVLNASLVQGKIDLAECWKGSDFAVLEGIARKDGLKVGRIEYGKFKMDTYGSGIVSSDKMLNMNPDVVRRFLKVTYHGYADMVKEPDAAADATLQRYPTLNRDDTLQQVKEQTELLLGSDGGTRLGFMDRVKMDRTLEFLAEVYKTRDVRVDDLYSNDFLPP